MQSRVLARSRANAPPPPPAEPVPQYPPPGPPPEKPMIADAPRIQGTAPAAPEDSGPDWGQIAKYASLAIPGVAHGVVAYRDERALRDRQAAEAERIANAERRAQSQEERTQTNFDFNQLARQDAVRRGNLAENRTNTQYEWQKTDRTLQEKERARVIEERQQKYLAEPFREILRGRTPSAERMLNSREGRESVGYTGTGLLSLRPSTDGKGWTIFERTANGMGPAPLVDDDGRPVPSDLPLSVIQGHVATMDRKYPTAHVKGEWQVAHDGTNWRHYNGTTGTWGPIAPTPKDQPGRGGRTRWGSLKKTEQRLRLKAAKDDLAIKMGGKWDAFGKFTLPPENQDLYIESARVIEEMLQNDFTQQESALGAMQFINSYRERRDAFLKSSPGARYPSLSKVWGASRAAWLGAGIGQPAAAQPATTANPGAVTADGFMATVPGGGATTGQPVPPPASAGTPIDPATLDLIQRPPASTSPRLSAREHTESFSQGMPAPQTLFQGIYRGLIAEGYSPQEAETIARARAADSQGGPPQIRAPQIAGVE